MKQGLFACLLAFQHGFFKKDRKYDMATFIIGLLSYFLCLFGQDPYPPLCLEVPHKSLMNLFLI